jgi:Protein of unknown function (DUF429)
MRTTRTGDVSQYLGADLTDRYARAPRAVDVCGLTPLPGGKFAARFWTWIWDAGPRPLLVGPLVDEIGRARVVMLDGPQGLARPPAAMRVCEQLTRAPGQTPHQLPPFYVPFAGFIHSSVELFAALHAARVPISPAAGRQGCGEVYPGDMWPTIVPRLPKKGTPEGDRLRNAALGMLGVVGLPAHATHDQNDAAIAALAAAALDGVVSGVATQLVGDALYSDKDGVLREGTMVRLGVASADLQRRLTSLVSTVPAASSPVQSAAVTSARAPAAHDARMLERANDLHTRFVEAVNEGRPVIASYSWVYGRLFGAIPKPWSQAHGGEVAAIAHRTALIHVDSLGLVALDTFVAGSKTGVPGPGLWSAVAYREADWNRVFRRAHLLHGAARAPWES